MVYFGRVYSDIVAFSVFFSIFFCFLCSLVDNLLSFWIFLELCGLSLVPCFFYSSGVSVYGFYSSLLSYIIMSGLSSVLLISGVLFNQLYHFIFFGFALKLGLFPFSFWVYRVFSESNWIFIFLLSVVMKFPVLFFCFLYSNYSISLVYVDCFLTIAMCSLFLWGLSNNWEYIWCHISLSSISTLVACCFCTDTVVCYFIYFYYAAWGMFCVIYFYWLESNEDYNSSFWVYCFLLLVTPLSMPLFYKLSVCYGLIYSTFYVLFIWSVYSFSEQFFLYKNSSNFFYSIVYNNWIK